MSIFWLVILAVFGLGFIDMVLLLGACAIFDFLYKYLGMEWFKPE